MLGLLPARNSLLPRPAACGCTGLLALSRPSHRLPLLPWPAAACPPLPAEQCFQCWEDAEQGCINMITEFFTSGALRCAA